MGGPFALPSKLPGEPLHGMTDEHCMFRGRIGRFTSGRLSLTNDRRQVLEANSLINAEHKRMSGELMVGEDRLVKLDHSRKM